MLVCTNCNETFETKDELYCVITINDEQVCGCPFCETDEHLTENNKKIERVWWK